MVMGSLILAAVIGTATLADPPDFAAVGPEDGPATGTLVSLTADGTAGIATADGNVTVRAVISLRRSSIPIPPLPRGPVLITTAGDRIPGRLVGGDDQSLRFQAGFTADEWEVPISAAAVVWVARPPADTPVDPARYPWLADRRNRDTLRFRNGDTVPGTLDGFATPAPAVRFKPDTGEARAVPLAELSVVAFNPTLARPRKPKGPYARLVLRDGTRLALVGVTADADTLKGKTLFGRAVEVPLADLVALDVIGGKAVYLADVRPRKVEQAGFLGQGWPWAVDRTVRGASLQLLTPIGEATFDRGLGTHPRTVLTYDLGGKYRRFESLVGLDAASGGRGRAVVHILVDGKEQDLPDLQKLTARPAVPVRVDVRGAKELTLVVDFGPAGDVQADVDWGDARLVE
ncbi:MAG: hypothetical protein JWO38_2225 [Gemmataceae bacterium]|nr:hypothetical protein [Gemmataceae bacterium]